MKHPREQPDRYWNLATRPVNPGAYRDFEGFVSDADREWLVNNVDMCVAQYETGNKEADAMLADIVLSLAFEATSDAMRPAAEDIIEWTWAIQEVLTVNFWMKRDAKPLESNDGG